MTTVMVDTSHGSSMDNAIKPSTPLPSYRWYTKEGIFGQDGWLRTFLRFMGPGYMVAVGYMDPGNWATDLAAGASFGYSLLCVIFISNLIAIFLQTLTIRLGLISGRDLSSCCRFYFSRPINFILYIFAEIAIIATDLAEVIGTAIALQLLFNIPLPYGVAITALDVFIVLLFWGDGRLRWFEFGIMALITVVGTCFFILLAASNPNWIELFKGYIPNAGLAEPGAVYIALGILGATVMPHNLYLHSNLVLYRSPSSTNDRTSLPGKIRPISNPTLEFEPPTRYPDTLNRTLKYSVIDTAIALTFAFLVNSSILIVAAAAFEKGDEVSELVDAYHLLQKYLTPTAGLLFAIALLFAGQSSTITGTLTGQMIMEGFLGSSLAIKPWLRRLITRAVAIVPAMIVAITNGGSGLNNLLVLSQVVLSIQLPFAVWPLVWFTGRAEIMGVEKEGSEKLLAGTQSPHSSLYGKEIKSSDSDGEEFQDTKSKSSSSSTSSPSMPNKNDQASSYSKPNMIHLQNNPLNTDSSLLPPFTSTAFPSIPAKEIESLSTTDCFDTISELHSRHSHHHSHHHSNNHYHGRDSDHSRNDTVSPLTELPTTAVSVTVHDTCDDDNYHDNNGDKDDRKMETNPSSSHVLNDTGIQSKKIKKDYRNGWILNSIGYFIAILITGLNILLVIQVAQGES